MLPAARTQDQLRVGFALPTADATVSPRPLWLSTWGGGVPLPA